MTSGLTDKVVWVTGASRGIGRAAAVACARAGARLVLVARTTDHLRDCVNEINLAGGIAPIVLDYDITDQATVGKAFAAQFKELKRVDVLVNNAGIMQDALLGMVTSEQVKNTFSVNVFAALYHMQFVARLMTRSKQGSIINIASIIGRVGNPGQTVYAASKAALIGATLSSAKELAPTGVRVNAIAPGMIETDMVRQLSPEKRAKRVEAIGFGRMGTPEEVADVIVFLASDASRYVTGQILGVDGAMMV